MNAVFTCSVDDGHPADLKTATLLDKHGLAATFYIPINNREGSPVMGAKQLRQLGKGFEIGSHTRDHRYLKNISARDAYDQVMDGKKALEDMLGHGVSGFCYPGGKFSRRDEKLVEACGFGYARTTANLCFSKGKAAYRMPTTVQFFPHEASAYLRGYVETGGWHARQDGLRIALQHQDWTDRLFAMFDHACEHGGVFHLWMHSEEIDELGLWKQLDGFFAYVSARLEDGASLTNLQLSQLG
ncbi:Polysaccharide deacetylase [Noviherbaspirillum humi]|uniref:Polysaccharide deacetylase n=1 Tax=Noviherbaspirillum humi TaxID=1688639 RepID=A0A239HSU5_9BURK|nr:polysaccharide deacetylase family protein [Noviherbaspirillum humi]SNS83354.1 Polysaccharide deacetylase [Noviherbaspirillum humi]